MEKLQRIFIVICLLFCGFAILSVSWLIITHSGHDIYDPKERQSIFQEEFGFPPPSSVTGIQINDYTIKSRGRRYIHFHTDAATFQRIIASGFTPSADWFFAGTGGNSVPRWWQPPHSRQVDVGTAISWHSKYPFTQAHIMRDPKTGDVFLYWYGSEQNGDIQRI